MRFGRWWAFQMHAGLSLGVHLELRALRTNAGTRFGPYIDLHVGPFVFSLGVNPIYAGESDLIQSFSRGGISAEGA
jgi:hypothetical protein